MSESSTPRPEPPEKTAWQVSYRDGPAQGSCTYTERAAAERAYAEKLAQMRRAHAGHPTEYDHVTLRAGPEEDDPNEGVIVQQHRWDSEAQAFVRVPELKIVVQMFGGTIEVVQQDSERVLVTDVVFLEHRKYAGPDPEFYVLSDQDYKGPSQQFVYSHLGCHVADPDWLARVMNAAQQRIAAAERNAHA